MRQRAAVRMGAGAGLALVAIGLFVTAGAAGEAPPHPQPPTHPGGDAPGSWHWPLHLNLPESVQRAYPDFRTDPERLPILVWTPPEVKRIRAVLLIMQNTDSMSFGAYKTLREVAARREMGIVYLRFGVYVHDHLKRPERDLTSIQAILGRVAERTGIVEYRHAPWIPFGKSSVGRFPAYMAWNFPERTLATIVYHGEVPPWGPPNWPPGWARFGHTILHVNANGEIEWGGTWYRHVRPGLLNFRQQKGWLPHQVVAFGINHGDYPESTSGKDDPTKRMSRLRIWDYLALFIDKAIEIRLPKGAYPTKGPIELNEIDDAGGYCIDARAVEELFGLPHLPLIEKPEGYVLNAGDDAPVSGYAAFAPLKGFTPAEGMPVVKPDTSVQGLKDWIVTDSLKFPMKADPMLELGDLQHLMPKAGDQVTIDGRTAAFKRILPKDVAKEGGIALNTGLRPAGRFTMLAFTVLDIAERKHYRLVAPFTAATRQQIVLNGVPVHHKQVLELQPGRYPLLMVLRMTVKWGRVGPWLEDVTEAEVAQAKQMQAEADKRAAEQARLDAAGPQPPPVLIRKASDVPAAERKKMFWVADREQAEAWFRLHAIKGQTFDVP